MAINYDASQFLLLRPTYKTGESAADHLLRAFSANGRTWNEQNLKRAGVGRMEIQSIEAGALEVVEKMTGIRPDGLRATTPNRMDTKTVEIAGQSLHRDHWTTESRRWCPLCWEEDVLEQSGSRPKEWNVHRRFWWSVAPIGTCPRHNVRLRETCPECERPVFWFIGSLHQCKDGHCLMAAKPEHLAPELTCADAYIVARLTGGPNKPVPLLDSLPLGDAIEAITRLGAAVFGGTGINLKSRRSTREVEMMAAGFDMATNWPRAFVEHLKIMKAKSNRWGSEKTFGELYRWARNLGASEFAEELRRVFYGCISEDRYVKPSCRVSAYVTEPVLTLKDVCKKLRISSPSAHRYLEVLGHPVLGSKKGTPVTVSSEAFDALSGIFRDQFDQTSSAAYLGIARGHLRELARLGKIQPTAIHGLVSKSVQYFAKEELDRFQGQILAGLPVLDGSHVTKRGLVTIRKAAQTGKAGQLPRLLQQLLDCHLKAAGLASKGGGLSRILLEPDAVREVRGPTATQVRGSKQT